MGKLIITLLLALTALTQAYCTSASRVSNEFNGQAWVATYKSGMQGEYVTLRFLNYPPAFIQYDFKLGLRCD